jgi:hypothetical protein
VRREKNGLSNNRRRDVIHRKPLAHWRFVRLKDDGGDTAVIVDDVIVIFKSIDPS